MKQTFFLSVALFGLVFSLHAQSVEPTPKVTRLPEGVLWTDMESRTVVDERVRRFVLPQRILWQSQSGIRQENRLLEPVTGQTSTAEWSNGFTMEYKDGEGMPSILMDFGAEIHGGIRLEARDLRPGENSVGKTVRVRVRFGESADEAMAEMGEKGAVNDHSVRDMIVNLPWLGMVEFGESAFRFARLDLVDPGTMVCFDSVRAVFTYRDLPWLGAFRCSDERLNTIWRTAAHTQHLTMQGYVIEGAKRDRLVWYGDIHPQAMTTLHVFGAPQVLRDTLGEYARTTWPLPKWMNGMPNYSLWWLISVSDLYRYTGNIDDLKEQHQYIRGLMAQLAPHVADNGFASFGNPFLDWPTADKPEALAAGTHAMFAIAFDRIAEIASVLNDRELETQARELSQKVRTYHPDNVNNKQAASLLALAGIEREGQSNIAVVATGQGQGFSTFYGYYMLEALASGGQKQVALDVIRDYWGAMTDVGATTFWEDFDLNWLQGSGRIDELTPPGLKSLHGDHGAYCYIGFRHSLCHGWASGPAAWLIQHVLGVEPGEPGFKTVKITPFLGDLDWAEGTIPTPHGLIHVRVEKQKDGSVKSSWKLPEGVKIEK